VTTTTQALLAVDGRFIAPLLGAGKVVVGSPQSAGTALGTMAAGTSGLSGTRLDGPSGGRRTAGSWAPKAGLVEHPQKSFAMAGAYIDANVWPLGPQGRSSG
jgi:hypothetical protein